MEIELLRLLVCADISEYNALAQYKLENENKRLKVVNVSVNNDSTYTVFYTELCYLTTYSYSTSVTTHKFI